MACNNKRMRTLQYAFFFLFLGIFAAAALAAALLCIRAANAGLPPLFCPDKIADHTA